MLFCLSPIFLLFLLLMVGREVGGGGGEELQYSLNNSTHFFPTEWFNPKSKCQMNELMINKGTTVQFTV